VLDDDGELLASLRGIESVSHVRREEFEASMKAAVPFDMTS
jgi:hypothetical protein